MYDLKNNFHFMKHGTLDFLSFYLKNKTKFTAFILNLTHYLENKKNIKFVVKLKTINFFNLYLYLIKKEIVFL